MSEEINITEWKWYRFFLKGEKQRTSANKCVGRAVANQYGFEVADQVIPISECFDIKEIENPFKDINQP